MYKRQGEKLSNEVIDDLKELIETDTANIKDLALMIKEEKLDLQNEDLKNLLVKLSKNKITIDNPNYSTFKKLID